MAFRPSGDGRVLAEFSSDEAELIATLARQVGELIADRAAKPGDPAIARLLPTAYPDDVEAAAEFRRFTENDLAARKVQNAETVIGSIGHGTAGLDGAVLDGAATQAWLRTLTDIRLTLAARLGIESDADNDADNDGDNGGNGNEDGAEALAMRDVYDWLGYVQDSLVRALDD